MYITLFRVISVERLKWPILYIQGVEKKRSHNLIAGSIDQNKKKRLINMGPKTNIFKDTSYFVI